MNDLWFWVKISLMGEQRNISCSGLDEERMQREGWTQTRLCWSTVVITYATDDHIKQAEGRMHNNELRAYSTIWTGLKLRELLALNKASWSSTRRYAAWWGGWWERLIRTVKYLLKHMLGIGNSRVNCECTTEFRTRLNSKQAIGASLQKIWKVTAYRFQQRYD